MEQARQTLVARRPSRSLAMAAWVAFAALFYGPLIDTRVNQGNMAGDLAAIESLVERRTFFIDDSSFDTIDKFKRGDRFFSQKSPIFHLAGAAICAPLHAAGLTLRTHPGVCLRALTLGLVVVPMGLLLWMLWDHPWSRGRSRQWRIGFAPIFAIGSLVTPFAITLNHYAAAAAALMMAARALTDPGGRPPRRQGLVVGFWIGLSLACDVPGAFLMGAALGGCWLVAGLRERTWGKLTGLALGALPVLLLYAGLNWAIVGSPLPPNLHEDEMQYFEGSFWKEVRDRAEEGRPEFYQASYVRRLWHATAGHKGIYWMMPLLVLATAAAGGLWRRREEGWRLAIAWAVFPPASIAVTMVWAFDLSGGAYNIRHCLATVPPLYGVLAHPALRWSGAKTRWLAGIAAGWGCVIAAIGLINPWSHNTLSAWPPLENAARLALAHPDRLPTDWIGPLIDATSVKPANGWLDLGLARMEAGAMGEAATALREATRLEPDRALPYYHLSIAQARQGRFGDAIASCRRLLELEPENIGGWNNLGMMALQAGRNDVAQEAYAASARLAPGNASALYGQLLLSEREGGADANDATLEEALRRYPEDARFLDLARRWGKEE
jgi:Tfp pilus assembly protein PilF